MPTLDKKWFKEKGDMPLDLARSLSTASFHIGVTETLCNLGWDGKPVANVGLELSPDNARVIRSQFLLHGLLTKEAVSLTASKLFPEADPAITMSVTIPDSAEFRFNDGSLSSDLVPAQVYKHHFSKHEGIIFPTDWAANNIGETSMRAVCHLDKSSNGHAGPKIKVTILLFPRSAGDMVALSDNTQSAAWPGIRILQSTCEFFPKSPAWKDPICPLLMPGSPYYEAPNLPTGDDIRFHVAAVMRSAKLPTACTTGSGLARQWAKATSDVENMEKEPTICWPDIPRPVAPQGNSDLPVNVTPNTQSCNIPTCFYPIYMFFPYILSYLKCQDSNLVKGTYAAQLVWQRQQPVNCLLIFLHKLQFFQTLSFQSFLQHFISTYLLEL